MGRSCKRQCTKRRRNERFIEDGAKLEQGSPCMLGMPDTHTLELPSAFLSHPLSGTFAYEWYYHCVTSLPSEAM